MIGDEFLDALCFAGRWTRRIVLIVAVMILCGCQYTNCTFTSVKLISGGEMKGDVKQNASDKSTTGAVTPTQTVSPQTSVTGIPGM